MTDGKDDTSGTEVLILTKDVFMRDFLTSMAALHLNIESKLYDSSEASKDHGYDESFSGLILFFSESITEGKMETLTEDFPNAEILFFGPVNNKFDKKYIYHSVPVSPQVLKRVLKSAISRIKN